MCHVMSPFFAWPGSRAAFHPLFGGGEHIVSSSKTKKTRRPGPRPRLRRSLPPGSLDASSVEGPSRWPVPKGELILQIVLLELFFRTDCTRVKKSRVLNPRSSRNILTPVFHCSTIVSLLFPHVAWYRRKKEEEHHHRKKKKRNDDLHNQNRHDNGGNSDASDPVCRSPARK